MGQNPVEMLTVPSGGSCPRVVDTHWLDNSQDRQATAYVVLYATAEVAAVNVERVATNLWLSLDAVREGSAVVMLYLHDGETTARVLFPYSVRVSKKGDLSVFGYCTKAKDVRAFRLERMLDAHAFTTPDEMPQKQVA